MRAGVNDEDAHWATDALPARGVGALADSWDLANETYGIPKNHHYLIPPPSNQPNKEPAMQRPDEVTVTYTASESKYEPHPDGQFAAVCVDVIDLGERVDAFPGSPEKLSPKVALVFATGEVNSAGQPIYPTCELSRFFSEKATLRKHLESWRGRAYTADDLRAGIKLHKLVGVPCLLNIVHKQSGKGRTYANILNITPLPKGMTAPRVGSEYVRAPYWADRIAEYAAGVASFKERIGVKANAPALDPLSDEADDANSLPF